ncbi:MAG: hypothetical protein B6D44_02240 [Ignavibacteriales bacterium UTCHB2]|mgnify:CR=1 FL=1|jgi:hypothetical protein|nr:MAG: hypothetical protein B6D44_02240 [Ignavibacteriales bacterium UTCHB2]HQI41314.1 D-glucuronyl C5-epimerase family protein [Ignavibacteriaceae bacterium]
MKLETIKNYFNKIFVFFFPERAVYWNSITPCSIQNKPTELGRYYLDFSKKLKYTGPFNDSGIPLYSYKGRELIEHPTVISQYAFGVYEELLKSNFLNKDLYKKFFVLADWFVENAAVVKDGKGWWIKIKYYSEYKMADSWISAMAQGQAISVLTRAARLSNRLIYASTAVEALKPFNYSVAEGGLVNYFNGISVYEECPTPHKPMAVLNGWIFSLFGLYDLYLYNSNQNAKDLFYEGIDSLKRILKYYDIGNWTQYYLFDYPKVYYASLTYHILATEQLKAIYYLTGDQYFLNIYIKWNKYSESFVNKTKALFNKVITSNKLFKN